MTSLPQPRAFLTSLLNAISAIPLSQPPNLPPSRQYHESVNHNPLKSVPPGYRHLLTTIHVLFPTILLPALDLLDRRLVTRLSLAPQSSEGGRYAGREDEEPQLKDETREEEDDGRLGAGEEEGAAGGGDLEPGPAAAEDVQHQRGVRSRSMDLKDGREEKHELPAVSSIFIVKSAQSAQPRRRKAVQLGGMVEDPAGKMYVVRLGAWNCTCAAFAFAAFPGRGGGIRTAEEKDARADRGGDAVGGQAEGDWEFGGMSLDGTGDGGGVPCCKHLLACLLAERWQEGFGGFVEDRRMGRNEMAGIVADI